MVVWNPDESLDSLLSHVMASAVGLGFPRRSPTVSRHVPSPSNLTHYGTRRTLKIDPTGVDIHALRANWITYEIDSGRNPKHVQYIAGHKTFAMTMDTYHKIRPEALLQSASRLPYFLEGQDSTEPEPEAVVTHVVTQGDKRAG